jgi:iron only hydrogenase large subunit-like protein
MGRLAKTYLRERLGLPAGAQLYHATVMPCYDKKLEAASPEFNLEGAPEVDCVLTTGELLELLQANGYAAADPAAADPAAATPTDGASAMAVEGAPELTGVEAASGGGLTGLAAAKLGPHLTPLVGPNGALLANLPGDEGTGGYLETVFRQAALRLFGVNLPPGEPLPYKRQRNDDFREVDLVIGGEVVLRFAAAYGFRNIQTLVRKLRSKRAAYHYVEVMACPGGCNNGGGQIRPAATSAVRLLPSHSLHPAAFHRGQRRVPAGLQASGTALLAEVAAAYKAAELGQLPVGEVRGRAWRAH